MRDVINAQRDVTDAQLDVTDAQLDVTDASNQISSSEITDRRIHKHLTKLVWSFTVSSRSSAFVFKTKQHIDLYTLIQKRFF